MSTISTSAVKPHSRQDIMEINGSFKKISGNKDHHLELSVRQDGFRKKKVLKLRIESTENVIPLISIGERDKHNSSKIYIEHDFGFAAFTVDYTGTYLLEENLKEGKNWMWRFEPINE